jgi:hypothetical protein
MTSTLAQSENRKRALKLLGSGISNDQVASALGVTPAVISQLLAEPEFAEQVTALRVEQLQANTARDEKIDDLEDRVLQKLKTNIGLMLKPDQLLRAFQIINNAKRRGQVATAVDNAGATLVNLTMPTSIIQQYSHFDINNAGQVIKAGGKDLRTIESNELMNQLKNSQAKQALMSLQETIDDSKRSQTEDGAANAGIANEVT